MPKMLIGKELEDKLTVMPEYDAAIRNADAGTRLMALNSLADIYIPNAMSTEVYSKLYLSMLHSLGKKQTITAVRQGNQNFRRIQGLSYNSVLGGSDSFSIIGPSGIGKSTTIGKCLALAGGMNIIETQAPIDKIIGCINVQCSYDCSVKGLLLAILRQLDELLDTRYAELAVKNKYTIDVLIGTVSQVALNNILLIVIDECQNISYTINNTKSWNGRKLVSALTQLINSSGVSICMVGLPQMEDAFVYEQLARRSIGLTYSALPYDDYFIRLCRVLHSYQFVKNYSEISPDIIETLYECSGGIIAILISLIMEAQQIAILSGKEILNKETIRMAYDKRMKSVHEFVEVEHLQRKQTSSLPKPKKMELPENEYTEETEISIETLLKSAKRDGKDIYDLMANEGITMEEMAI